MNNMKGYIDTSPKRDGGPDEGFAVIRCRGYRIKAYFVRDRKGRRGLSLKFIPQDTFTDYLKMQAASRLRAAWNATKRRTGFTAAARWLRIHRRRRIKRIAN